MVLMNRPCVDSAEHARQRQAELQIDYSLSQQYAVETLSALAAGRYRAESGVWVEWAADVAAARDAAVSIPPEVEVPPPARRFPVTTVTVANATSLAAARAMHDAGRTPLVLNMANGATPGGGFRHGSRAQEEFLCRGSALYATIEGDPMYDAHRAQGGYESSDWAILSPRVPVFRDDTARTLGRPWSCAFLTCAAPVATRVGQPRSAELMEARIRRVLGIAAAHGFADLVLGAWGCGAFGNDATATAQSFRESFAGPFEGAFDQVVFAVTDWSPERRFLGPFRDAFPALGPEPPERGA
jgi:uncharacterized protein (TIGR02452 family)